MEQFLDFSIFKLNIFVWFFIIMIMIFLSYHTLYKIKLC